TYNFEILFFLNIKKKKPPFIGPASKFAFYPLLLEARTSSSRSSRARTGMAATPRRRRARSGRHGHLSDFSILEGRRPNKFKARDATNASASATRAPPSHAAVKTPNPRPPPRAPHHPQSHLHHACRAPPP